MRSRSLFTRLLSTHLIVAVVAIASLGVAVDRVFEHRALQDLKARLIAEARTVQSAISMGSTQDLEQRIRTFGAASGARVTVIRTNGVVIADSEHDPATMENHATPSRPEVLAAIAGRIGSAQRVSETLDKPFLYVAIPPRDGVIVRTALPASIITSQRNSVRLIVLSSFLGVALLSLALSVLMARGVAKPLARIAQNVASVGREDFLPLEPRGPREARALTKAVNRVAAELAQRVDDIQAETDLRDQILGAMEEAVILVERGRVVYRNRAAGTLLGVEAGNQLPAVLAAFAADADTSKELTTHHPSTRTFRAAATSLGPERKLVVAQDVTDAHRLDSIRRDFVANASHELKTPVAGILATAETLPDALEDDPANAKRFVDNLANEARRLSSLVQDLLDLARLDQPGFEMTTAPLSNLVREVVEESLPNARAKRLTVDSSIDEGIEVRGRPWDLALLARNLLDNAIRYTGEGGRITIELQREDGHARLAVGDTGVGIPTKDLPRIFERFYRVDKARARETGGTGLGLSIVRHVAESHGGSVTVESQLGAGSTFTVLLPAGTTR